MTKRENILNEIKRIVNEKEPSAKIYLYGSRARENERIDSDWDLLILISEDKVSHEMEQKIIYPLYDLEFDTGEVISPMVYSENEWNGKYRVTPFYQTVMNESIQL